MSKRPVPRVLIALLSSLTLSQAGTPEPLPALIPRPASITLGKGEFQLSPGTSLQAVKAEEIAAAEWLADQLRKPTGYALPVKADAAARSLGFFLDTSLKDALGNEGYRLDATPGSVKIQAATAAGLFYGAQSFRQLLPPQAYGRKKAADVTWSVPAVKIEDRPRFAWRGFMIDTSRHFFPVEFLKQLIDDMASQKLNLLQLHLTDDDGWRVEIKKYPKLTEIGAWRGTECPLPNTREGETFKRYGGFYTQEQLKELVAYAKQRHIEIMPEVDLPGHALAIATAYPETLPEKLSEAVSVQGYKANAISPAKEANYQMVDDIIGEIAAIFPYPYIHIGGDEVNHKIWEECPQIKALMEKEKLSNLHQVQVHFTRRLEGIITKHGRKMIGWQEIADDRLSRDTAIMAWISAGPGWNAAKRGTPAVMAPGGNCYFDMPYPNAQDEPPAHWWAGPVGIEQAYGFDPVGPESGLDEAGKAKVLGVHAALWTEFVIGWDSKSGWLKLKDESECASYKIWPRLCATAETGWTPQAERNFTSFRNRLGGQFARFAEMGRVFRLEPPSAKLAGGLIHIQPPYTGAQVKYTVDGSDPFANKSAKLWDGKPLDGNVRGGLAMRTVMPAYSITSPLSRGAIIEPAGTWEVRNWKAGEPQVLTFKVRDHISEPGRWRVRMARTKGGEGLAVDRMTLRSGTKTLPSAPITRPDSAIFEIPQTVPADLELIVDAKFTGPKPDAAGTVLIEKLTGEVIPGLTIETKIPHHGAEFDASQLLDGDSDTYQWSSRVWEKDETLTWVFPQLTLMKEVALQSGAPNGTKDQILDAVLEVSTDGSTFTDATGFTYGAAKIGVGGKFIKAVRIRATGKSPGWVILQDLRITRDSISPNLQKTR